MVLPRFLAELKRRKVYRVALVYAGVGWALLEAADVVLPRLALPDWTVNLVLALILLGFPLALVFAWIFEFSPQGVVRTEPLSPEDHPHRLNLPAIVEFLVIVALVAAVGGLYVDRLSLQKRLAESESALQESPGTDQPVIPQAKPYRAIAVLPFADMSENKDQDWFAEGIAEELLIALSQVKPLSVKARTSSFAFRGTDKTVAEIADILGVQAVLEGSVRRFNDRVRVTAQLVDAHSGFRIWSGSYERQITDIFALQDELAKSVVEALRIELGVGLSLPLVAEQTRIPEAYDWFMRGRALLDWPNGQGPTLSIVFFEKAVELDPDYATAWGYISYAYMLMLIYRPLAEVAVPLVTAYQRALALEPEQSEALAAKAVITQLVDKDWEAAGRIYQRAIVANEGSHACKRGYAIFYLQFIDKQAEAVKLFADTVKLDPLHAGRKASLASILFFSGDVEGAIREARGALQLVPDHIIALNYLIEAYTQKNDILSLESLLASLPPALREQPALAAQIARSYALRGDEEAAREIYRELVTSIDSLAPISLINTANLAFTLDEFDEGFDLLERLQESGSWIQFWSKLLPLYYESIREHPRYQAIMKRMGLDEESVAALNSKMSFD